jgi:hypothetical protein
VNATGLHRIVIFVKSRESRERPPMVLYRLRLASYPAFRFYGLLKTAIE